MHKRVLGGIVSTAAAAALLAGPATTTGLPAPDKSVSQRDNGKTVELGLRNKLTITLKETPGTGYSWRIVRAPSSKVVTLVSNRFVAPQQTDPPTVGAAGKRVIKYRARKAGATSLEIDLFPPGQGARPAKNFKLKVKVTT